MSTDAMDQSYEMNEAKSGQGMADGFVTEIHKARTV